MMETEKNKDIGYELISDDGVNTYVIRKKRILIGSGESCDHIINKPDVEGVHAVIEVTPNGVRAYDMNTAVGTFVNGQQAIVKDAHVGDQICFGNICFTLDSFDASCNMPDADIPIPPILTGKENEKVPVLTPKRINKSISFKKKKGSYDEVEYPLGNYANADRLEYIFELPENIKNVLHYDHYQKSIEVTIAIGSRVFSVDYLDASNSEFFLFGDSRNKKGAVLPYLGKDEDVLFMEMRQGKYFVHKIDGFDFLNLGNKNNDQILCDNESLGVFLSDHVKVFFRMSAAPPQTLEEPFIQNDRVFWKFFALVIGVVSLFLIFVGIMDVNEEMKEKKAPQKLASILYKKPVLSISVDKTKKKNKKIAQKAKKSLRKTKKIKNKTFAKKRKSKIVAKKKSNRVKKARVSKSKKKSTNSKKTGNIDTYKAIDFSASLPSALSKGGDIKNFQNEQVKDFKYDAGTPAAKNLADKIDLNAVESKTDNISKSTSKNLDDTGALSDFQSDKKMATAGIPSRTVVLGGMDPDTIRKILMDHLPQFRFCYQKELDKASKEFSGRITLNFVIGASGYVTRAGVKESSMPQVVKSCVVNVLKGIPFPAPRGGGVVEVTQPMNFYPKE